MTCTSPWLHRSPDGAIINLPCGKCLGCRIQRANEWAARIIHEASYYENTGFLTMTYDQEHLPLDESISKYELQSYFKRLRMDLQRSKYHTKNIKYFACGEYGDDNNRPHYHAIIFGLSYKDKEILFQNWLKCDPKRFTIGTVTFNSARYVASYVLKKYDGKKSLEVYGSRTPPFVLMSKGIGKRFVLDNHDFLLENKGFTVQGKKVGLSRYYKSKLDITSIDLKGDAIEREKELRKEYYQRGHYEDYNVFRQKVRENAERILNAKLDIKRSRIL